MSSPYGRPPVAPPSARESGAAGLARILALVTGGLALVVYFVSFGDDAGLYTRTGFSLVLLLGGGLLAAASVLPRAPRVLVPATVLVAVGTLLLLLEVAKDPTGFTAFDEDFDTPGLAIVVLIIAFFELAACVGALLADQGLLGAGRAATGQQGWGASPAAPAPFSGQGPLGGQPGSGPQQVAPSAGVPSQPQPVYGAQQPVQGGPHFGGQYGGQPGDYGQQPPQQPLQQPGQYGAPGQYGPQG